MCLKVQRMPTLMVARKDQRTSAGKQTPQVPVYIFQKVFSKCRMKHKKRLFISRQSPEGSEKETILAKF